MGEGTLAQVPLFGSAPRPLAEHVREADWTPDGAELAIVRRVNGRERLELPVGTPLYETSGYISHIRVSRNGQHVAFADHPVYSDDNGSIAVVDRAGVLKTLASGFHGFATRSLSTSTTSFTTPIVNWKSSIPRPSVA